MLQEHQDTRMPHKPREANSCGSGTETIAKRGYQTTAHTTGRTVSRLNDRIDAYGELFGAILPHSRTRGLTVLAV